MEARILGRWWLRTPRRRGVSAGEWRGQEQREAVEGRGETLQTERAPFIDVPLIRAPGPARGWPAQLRAEPSPTLTVLCRASPSPGSQACFVSGQPRSPALRATRAVESLQQLWSHRGRLS
jgi:hypothetical protein